MRYHHQLPSAVMAVVELGFPELITQSSYREGMRASELIDYLLDHFDNLEEEEYAIKEKQRVERECRQRTEASREREELEKETQRLQRSGKCGKCHSNDRSHVVLPCSHLALCNSCVLTERVCPLCREDIQMIIRTFF
jgi:hypothetical protein